jgi:hypothetical protein
MKKRRFWRRILVIGIQLGVVLIAAWATTDPGLKPNGPHGQDTAQQVGSPSADPSSISTNNTTDGDN